MASARALAASASLIALLDNLYIWIDLIAAKRNHTDLVHDINNDSILNI
jgi:hypothetical protein